ncbi:MAG: DUF4912 domain-containing protein [Spirochaetaceae bacterium]|jgi:hypothetical protein|nr:DUF4912 domain-containing protein [Spirochaetaceae bacterium]
MGDQFSRPYLESLTTNELVRLADGFGVDIPPGLDRVFILEELLDLAAEETLEPGESAFLAETDIPEPVPLPKQYNITFIEVMLRDPLWVFVFWEIKAQEKDIHEKAPDFGGYLLKVSPLPYLQGAGQEAEVFTVPVGTGDSAWYLGFPPSGGRFKVELCVLRGSETVALAASHPFRLPKLLNSPDMGGGEIFGTPLIRLSGVEDFRVLRNFDRLSRVLRRCDP